ESVGRRSTTQSTSGASKPVVSTLTLQTYFRSPARNCSRTLLRSRAAVSPVTNPQSIPCCSFSVRTTCSPWRTPAAKISTLRREAVCSTTSRQAASTSACSSISSSASPGKTEELSTFPVLIGGRRGSCDCLGFQRYSHCKRADALHLWLQSGQLPRATP